MNVALGVNGKFVVDIQRAARYGAAGDIDRLEGSRGDKVGDDRAVHCHSEPVGAVISVL